MNIHHNQPSSSMAFSMRFPRFGAMVFRAPSGALPMVRRVASPTADGSSISPPEAIGGLASQRKVSKLGESKENHPVSKGKSGGFQNSKVIYWEMFTF